MWIFTTTGFVSAVRNTDDRTIIVRSRDRESLIPISKKCQTEIKLTPLADYPYRVRIEHDKFIEWISTEASNIDYPNFKSQVRISRGEGFASALGKVWYIMLQLADHLEDGDEVKT
jgi:hypothetical protein